MGKIISPELIADVIRDNIINAYTDYCYMMAIAGQVDRLEIPIIVQSLNDYCCFINEILEMIKRDLINCLYKLLLDGNGKTFEDFLKTFNAKGRYNDYILLSKSDINAIKEIRNQYLDHISPLNKKHKIELKNMQSQIIKLKNIYNEIVATCNKVKTINDNQLTRIETGAKNGVNLMFDNKTHKIIYK